MKRLSEILWATDNIQIGNVGTRHFLRFTIHTPKSKDDVCEFYSETYKDIGALFDEAKLFVKQHAKPSCIPPS